MAFKIALSAGHGKNTAGKRCMKKLDPNQTREWVLNDRIADKVEKLLKNYTGYELLRVDDTTGVKDIALRTRSNAANNFGADFYLAIHHNAGVLGGKGGGIVAFVYTKPTAESVEWQKALYNELIKETGLKGNRSTPIAKANFHEVREPKMPSVLLELGFMDSKTDVPIILTEKFADQCAKAIVAVLVKKGKLTKKKTTTNVTTTTTTANFKTGDEVKLVSGAKYTSGASIPDWVFKKKLYVRELHGNDVVISTLKTGAVTGIVNKKYLTAYATSTTFKAYKVQVTVDALNIRKGAGTNYAVVGCIKDRGTYTIVEEKNNWGKLSNGNGWIYLSYTKKV